MLELVLDAAAGAALRPVVVVVGHAAADIEAAVRWTTELRVRNPKPNDGLASSLRVGLAAVAAHRPSVAAVVILLGDQPRVRPDVIRALVERWASTEHPIVVPRYALGGGPNPLVLDRSAFELGARLTGDRGLGPLIEGRPEFVEAVAVEGANPDVDTPADLAGLL